jgi:hypothetical protein
MMTPQERDEALAAMDQAITQFYRAAAHIGNHPFIEFAGVMTAYAKSCERAHRAGIDFTQCSRHAGSQLPMEAVEVDYLNEKLGCIFGGRIVAREDPGNARWNALEGTKLLKQSQERLYLWRPNED